MLLCVKKHLRIVGYLIDENERLIVVLGMAHSGTTSLTYILQQHPETVCCVNGNESRLFENDWLLSEQATPIQALLKKISKRIILKRPWVCVDHADFLVREMPNAKFVYCYRSFEEMSKSWSKSNSFIYPALRKDLTLQKETYIKCLDRAETFKNRIPFFKKIFHPDFVANPKVTNDLVEWLDLTPFNFNFKEISYSKNIKTIL